ncbi:MAG: outer membrane beta-barrel protein [Bacteroidota bacterium]
MKTKALLSIVFVILLSATTLAQEKEKRFGFEFSSGVSMATNKLDESTLNPGFGFEGIFHYRFLPHTGVYAGWGWNRFGADESFAGNDVCFEETGYVFGLQFKHPFGNSPVQYYLRGGGLFNHIETENSNGEIINDTGHGLGWQLAAGIDVPLGKNWRFTPGVKFNALARNADFEGVDRELKHNYASLRVGILKRF